MSNAKCEACNGTRCIYDGSMYDPPSECDACSDNEPSTIDDFPTIGVTGFDAWMTQVYFCMFKVKFLEVTEFGTLDREHWRQYYDVEMTPQEAFEEDLTCYGD